MRQQSTRAQRLAVLASAVFLAWSPFAGRTQTAQESVERTIGGLVLQNANCNAQSMTQAEEIRKLRAELDALRPKQPEVPKVQKPTDEVQCGGIMSTRENCLIKPTEPAPK